MARLEHIFILVAALLSGANAQIPVQPGEGPVVVSPPVQPGEGPVVIDSRQALRRRQGFGKYSFHP